MQKYWVGSFSLSQGLLSVCVSLRSIKLAFITGCVIVCCLKEIAEKEQKKALEREIVKKERRDGRKCSKQLDEDKKPELPELDPHAKSTDNWIFDDDNASEKADSEKGEQLCYDHKYVPSIVAWHVVRASD